MNNYQFAKVLIQRDQNPAFGMGQRQDFGVSRVFRPLTGPHHIVASGLQGFDGSSPNAGVEEQLQASDSITIGSIRSRPMILRA